MNVAEAETANLDGLPLEAKVAFAGLAGAVKEGLLGSCADVGLVVMAQMLEEEMAARFGSKHAKILGRQANWHGTTKGQVVLGGREVTVTRLWVAWWMTRSRAGAIRLRSRGRVCLSG